MLSRRSLPLYERSKVATPKNESSGIKTVSSRTSSTASLPAEHPLVQCITMRASELQGYAPLPLMETLQATRYEVGQEYKTHYDWYPPSYANTTSGNRFSTIFAFLEAECEGGETAFPRLSQDFAARDKRWCDFAVCDDEPGMSEVRFRPRRGDAVFWRNLLDDWTGDERTLHAGRPVISGRKVGLNIWTKTNGWPQNFPAKY